MPTMTGFFVLFSGFELELGAGKGNDLELKRPRVLILQSAGSCGLFELSEP